MSCLSISRGTIEPIQDEGPAEIVAATHRRKAIVSDTRRPAKLMTSIAGRVRPAFTPHA